MLENENDPDSGLKLKDLIGQTDFYVDTSDIKKNIQLSTIEKTKENGLVTS